MDNLVLQRGGKYRLYGDVYIYQPTLNDIVNIGLEDYNSILSIMTMTPLDIADILYVEHNIWYEDIKSDFIFFIESHLTEKKCLVYNIKNEVRSIPEYGILTDESINNALKFLFKINGECVIISRNDNPIICSVIKDKNGMYYYDENSFIFNELLYNKTLNFLKHISWQANKYYNVVHGGTKYAKKYILKNEYNNRMDDIKKKVKPNITLDSIVSSIIAKGISYKEVWDLPIYMVYDLYYRFVQLNIWNNTNLALYTGNIDTKKHPINWEKINWSKVLN